MMAESLQMYIYKEGQTSELKRLRQVAQRVKEEINEIDNDQIANTRDLTPTRMEFIDYRKAYIKKEKVKKV